MPNVLSIIKADHDSAAELFSETRRLLGEHQIEDAGVRASFEKLRHALVNHLGAEEEAVYTRLRMREETRELSFESQAEHEIVLDLLEKLSLDSVIDEKWKGTFFVLKSEVERHVEDEELEILPWMRRLFSTEELEEMGEDMEAVKVLIEDTAFAPPIALKIGEMARGARPDTQIGRRPH